MTFDEARVGDRIICGMVPDEEMMVVKKDDYVVGIQRSSHPSLIPNSFYASEFNAAHFEKVIATTQTHTPRSA